MNNTIAFVDETVETHLVSFTGTGFKANVLLKNKGGEVTLKGIEWLKDSANPLELPKDAWGLARTMDALNALQEFIRVRVTPPKK